MGYKIVSKGTHLQNRFMDVYGDGLPKKTSLEIYNGLLKHYGAEFVQRHIEAIEESRMDILRDFRPQDDAWIGEIESCDWESETASLKNVRKQKRKTK